MKKIKEVIICDFCKKPVKETDLLRNTKRFSNIPFDDRGLFPDNVALKSFGFNYLFKQRVFMSKLSFGKPTGVDICSECESKISETLEKLINK